MEAGEDLKHKLRKLVVDSLGDTIKALKEYLPDHASKYEEVLILEGQLNEANKNLLLGLISNEDLQIIYNRLRKALLELIQTLSPNDFAPQASVEQASQQTAKQGNILYRIPHTMSQGQESKCVVRIALDQLSLVKNIELDEMVQVKNIRVSELMQVTLMDPSADQPFQIRTISSAEQFIEAAAYTEWLFYVTPLRVGHFPLILKVAVIELIHGKERKREIILEEKIQIFAESKPQKAEDQPIILKQASESLLFSGSSTAPEAITPLEGLDEAPPKAFSPQEKTSRGPQAPPMPQVEPQVKKRKGPGVSQLMLALILILAFPTYYFFLHPSVLALEADKMISIDNFADERRKVILADSTIIYLNSDSYIRYEKDFDAKSERNVYLTGEAYFEVANDPEGKPFRVNTDDALVEVLGTKFNLRAYPEDSLTELALVEGKIKLQTLDGEKAIDLSPGELGILDRSKQTLSISQSFTSNSNANAWKDNQFTFDQAPLSEVIPVLERHYGVQIEVENSSMLQCYYSSNFQSTSVREVLDMLSFAMDWELISEEGRYLLKGASCVE